MNVIDIEYDDPGFAERAPEEMVRGRLNAILSDLGVENVEFSCSFVSDDRIRELNRQWRGRDESTDILSFVQSDASGDGVDFDWPDVPLENDYATDGGKEEGKFEGTLLGDMVISLDSLKRNADYFSVSEDEELYRLLVHGVLHLLGEDHATNDLSEPMLMRQEQILIRLRG
ncbi:MAG: rRNA maturation RNase YbeY [Sphaerochaetaceae bacterium]|jgi:probable rRNA maturation factor